jgi:hypothetical protein
MSVRAAFVLGVFILLAALAHGGFYAAGHDFVVNRFTGDYEFVPDEGDDADASMAVRACRTLTSRRAAARVGLLSRRR